ncbi:hypothetical protein K9L67_00980 [Candidatus Woesearchaeota archaeon]|nr:hypothetical protein [Candidatus Woesearchaeota archaeon]MCF7900777.1 hypothetical protein [Candidatus Woesearchaeota archaeon]MCF8012942.1 hypothetical protein [Candidatus Woesearchaeota archaeon]
MVYYDASKLINYLDEHNISNKKILTTQPWVFDYYYNHDFLTSEEKKDYVFFPDSQWYEFYDRTRVYSVNGYWDEWEIKMINKIIEDKNIDYLILHTIPSSSEIKYNKNTILLNVKNISFLTTLDQDKYFGYHIFKVNK